MNKFKKILQLIRIEEYILFVFSLIILFIYLILSHQLIGSGYFKIGLKTVILGTQYFFIVLVFIYLFIFYKLYLYLINWLNPFCESGSFKSLRNPFVGIWFNIKNILINILILLRPFFLVTIFFGLLTLLLGFFASYLQKNLVDDHLMAIDRFIFKSYPFLWSYDWIPFFRYLSPLIVASYNLLGTMMAISWIVFYLIKKREIFSRYIIAMILSSIIGLSLWFFSPALTPQDHYLDNIYGLEISSSIQGLIRDYSPDQHVLNFQEGIRLESNETGGVSTMPSMHVTWALIIVYYFFKLKKKTIFITLPWFFLSTWGTFYLAEHYFIDILVALPIVIISIWLANRLVKIECKYYQAGKLDDREEMIKREFNQDVNNIFQFFKNIFFKDKKRLTSKD